jgi:hypothetical protein
MMKKQFLEGFVEARASELIPNCIDNSMYHSSNSAEANKERNPQPPALTFRQ